MNRKPRTITLKCQNEDCRRLFTIPDSTYERTRRMNLDLAVCPWCHQPRDPMMFYRQDVKLCTGCGFYKYLWAFDLRYRGPLICFGCRRVGRGVHHEVK